MYSLKRYFSSSLIQKNICKNEKDLEQLGAHTLSLLQKNCPIFLFGGVGVGKTCFARGLIREFLGNNQIIVNSPSFVLEKSYKNKKTGQKIYHYDLYRLTTSEEALEIGMDSKIKNQLCLIEWPELLTNIYKNRIDVRLYYNQENTDRLVTLEKITED